MKRYSGTPEKNYPKEIMAIPVDEIMMNASLMANAAVKLRQFKGMDYVNLPIHDAPFLRSWQIPITASWEEGVKITETVSFKHTKKWHQQVFDPIFEACERLLSQGEIVQYKMPGLMNLAIGFFPFEELILLSKKDNQTFDQLMREFIDKIHKVIKQLDELGVQKIYFFDSMGKIDLLGASYYKKYYAPYLIELFKIEPTKAQLILAPPIFKSLEAIGCLEEVASSSLVKEFRYRPVQLIDLERR